MDQIKIGKFISDLRKEKGLTQRELADKIGVTDRAISKWENGRGMPDISLLRKLSEVLDISINELLSAQKLDDDNKESKTEENYFDAVNKKNKLQSDVVGYIIYKILGLILFITGIAFFGIEGIWINLLVIIGTIFIVLSVYKLFRSYKLYLRIILCVVVLLILSIIISYFNYSSVDDLKLSKPHFYINKVTKGTCTLYKSYSIISEFNLKCISTNNKLISDDTCYINHNSMNDEYLFFGERFDNIEDVLESKYCTDNYNPYEDQYFVK